MKRNTKENTGFRREVMMRERSGSNLKREKKAVIGKVLARIQ